MSSIALHCSQSYREATHGAPSRASARNTCRLQNLNSSRKLHGLYLDLEYQKNPSPVVAEDPSAGFLRFLANLLSTHESTKTAYSTASPGEGFQPGRTTPIPLSLRQRRDHLDPTPPPASSCYQGNSRYSLKQSINQSA